MRNKLKTSTFFWPGSDVKVNGKYPDFFVKYDRWVFTLIPHCYLLDFNVLKAQHIRLVRTDCNSRTVKHSESRATLHISVYLKAFEPFEAGSFITLHEDF